MYADLLALPLYDALVRLCTGAKPVRIEIVTPPDGVSVRPWRTVRIEEASDDTIVVTVVGEIEGLSGCLEHLAPS